MARFLKEKHRMVSEAYSCKGTAFRRITNLENMARVVHDKTENLM